MPLRDTRPDAIEARESERLVPSSTWPQCASVEDDALVKRASEQIRSILGATIARGLEEIGKVLLREFFNNDPALYRSTSHHKHVSLRLLVERCETMDPPVRRTTLANALQMACLIRELPSHSPFLSLPPSHRVELLRAGSPARVDELAGRVLESKMTVKKIRETLRKERGKSKSKRGRKPLPPIVRTLRAAIKMLRDDTTGRLIFRRDDVDALRQEHLAQARADIDVVAKRIEEFIKLLG
ncbi:MAG: hypothetical protein HY898_00490 [Deltaproteobacteria bacterium]|nr:hypothetical protein [Deltaproteobacteria bacterium]